MENINDLEILSIIYDVYAEIANGVFIGKYGSKLDVINGKKVCTYETENIGYVNNRYLILHLENGVDVYDTVTGKTISELIDEPDIVIQGFVCEQNGAPYMSVYDGDTNYIQVLTDSFEIMKRRFRVITCSAEVGDNYRICGALYNNEYESINWEDITINKNNGLLVDRCIHREGI